MDLSAPCIVQALRAATSSSSHPPNPNPNPNPNPSGGGGGGTPSRSHPSPAASRCTTRSRLAPDWSVSDSLVLIEQIAAVDAELWSKSLSSFQKWKIVADNCAHIGFLRSSSLCRRRWDLLISDYKKIKRWETMRSGGGGQGAVSYWKMDMEWRERFGLPGVFSQEVYTALDAVVKIEGSRDVDSELLVIGPIDPVDDNGEHVDVPLITAGALSTVLAVPANGAYTYQDYKDKGKEEIDEALLSTEAWDLATKLQENAEHIQSLLKGETGGDPTNSDNNVDMAVAKEKTEKLIKTLGGLVQGLDEFTELVKSNGFENVVALNSY